MAAPKLRDVRKLADSRAVIDLELALTALPHFPAEYVAAGGAVKAHLVFGREQGYAMVRVELQAQVQATCQRCLGPVPLRLQASSPVLIVESEQEAEGAPAGWETYLAPEGRLVPEALVGEELLLALPIVPLHEPVSQCEPLADATPRAGAAAADVGADVGAGVDAGDLAGAGADGRGGAAAAAAQPPGPAEQATVRPFADLRAMLARAAKPGDGGAR